MLTDHRLETTKSTKQRNIIAAIVAIVVVGAIGALARYLTRPVPDEVSLESAVELVEADAGSSSDGLEGTWAVDTPVGGFLTAS